MGNKTYYGFEQLSIPDHDGNYYLGINWSLIKSFALFVSLVTVRNIVE